MYLHLDHLSKHFLVRVQTGTVAAVDEPRLLIEECEFITLFAPSVCGQTTTLILSAELQYRLPHA